MHHGGLSAFKAAGTSLKPGVPFLAKFIWNWREMAVQFARSSSLHTSMKGQELGDLDVTPTFALMVRKL